MTNSTAMICDEKEEVSNQSDEWPTNYWLFFVFETLSN
jgi:hypothetical protein